MAASSSNPKYEPFSTYYLHPSEGTGTIITPILLKGDNYEEWSRSIRNNLRAKNKIGFVDGTVTKPAKDSADYAQWGVVNSMLVAWIYNTLHDSIRSTVRLPDEAKVMWDDLKARYSIGNGPRILELKSKIADCRQHDKSVATYFGELRRLQDELASYQKIPTCTCTAASEFAKLQESDLLYQFCIGLDSRKFGSAVSTLLMQDPPPSLNFAYSRIIADERKQMISDSYSADRTPAIGFAVQASSSSSSVHSHDGEGSRPKCTYCHRYGHYREYCYDLHGRPNGTRGRGAARGGRGTRGGRGFSGRGAAASPSAAGRGFAAAAFSSHDRGSSVGNLSADDRHQAPTLTDEQWGQLLAALKSAPSSSEKLSGPHFEDSDWSGGAV